MAKTASEILNIIEKERKEKYTKEVIEQITLLGNISERMYLARCKRIKFTAPFELWLKETREWCNQRGFIIQRSSSSYGWELLIKE